MALADELERAATAAREFADDGEEVAGVLAAEAVPGARVYLCAFTRGDERSWLALDGDDRPVLERRRVRDAASIAALCELAEETAGGGHLEELRSQLATLRLTESPDGIDAAEAAALALEEVVGAPPRLAAPAYLDEVGSATRRLEETLGPAAASGFAAAMQAGMSAVEELAAEVELRYKLPFE